MAEIADLQNQLAKSNELLATALQGATDFTAKFQKSETDLTTRTDELVAERRQHSETKLKLQTAEGDLATEKAAHEKLKIGTEEKVQAEAAKIAAANGHPSPAAAAPAAAPGAVAEAVDKTKLSGIELLAMSLKNDIQH